MAARDREEKKIALKVMKELAENAEVDPQIRLNAAQQLIYQTEEDSPLVLGVENTELSELKERFDFLEQQVGEALEVFRHLTERD